jgi:hypothetical protein
MNNWLPWLVIAAAALLTAGCASLDSRTPPAVSKAEAPYALPGLAELAYRRQEASTPVRIFMLHGIGRHDVGWGKVGYLDNFLNDPSAKEHGWAISDDVTTEPVRWTVPDPAAPQANPPATLDYPAANFTGILRVYKIQDKHGRTCVVAYELTWSPLTSPFKDARFAGKGASGFNDEAQFRPLVNQTVRTVLDENLSDAVLYARGFDNNIIGQTVSHALQWFYTGKFDPDQTDTGKQGRRLSPTVFLTESLGSIILSEVMAAHVQTLTPLTKPAQRAGMRDVLRNLETIYMMANQIALLDIPAADPTGNTLPAPPAPGMALTPPAPAHSAFHAFVEARKTLLNEDDAGNLPTGEALAAQRPPRPLLVAAFNDLYDVLSYRVSPDSFPESEGIKIDNFYPKNAPVYVWPVKVYEDLDKAHTGYGANPDVIKLVMRGYAADGN